MIIGQRIKELRNEKGITQKDLSDKLFVTPQAISRWENDEVEPSLDILNKMAEIFGVTIDYIIGKEERKTETIIKEVEVAKPVLAVCEKCNRPIYNGNEIVRHTYGGRGFRAEHIMCMDCKKKQDKEIKELEIKESIKNRKYSFVFGGLITGLIFAIAIGITIGSGGGWWALLAGFISLLFFPLIGCLFLKNNFVGDMILMVCSWGFIKFPGLIFSLYLDGIVWLLTVKLAFWIIGFMVALAFLGIGIILGLIVSPFVYPFALKQSFSLH